MKSKFKICLSAFTLAAFCAATNESKAASLYWDTDDITAGAGGSAPNGTWSSGGLTWSTSANGTAATSAYTTLSGDDLIFSAGVSATAAYAITLNDTQSANSLTFRSGTATISGAGGVITLGSTGIINVTNSLVVAPNTAAIGANTDTLIAGSTGLTKVGVGTLTLNGTAANTFTGGLNVNGGTLGLNYANMATPTNLIDSGNAVSFGGGNIAMTSKGAGDTTEQTLGNVTVNSGGGSLLANPNGGTATNITLGSLTTTASGGALVVGRATSSGVGNLSITTTSDKDAATGTYGGRVVFADGTANTGYDWATTVDAASPFALSAYAGYTGLDTSTVGDVTDTNNSRITAGAVIPAASNRTTNSLKFENPATAQILDIGAGNTLTVSNGGLLYTGASVAQGPRINNGSITVGNGSGTYDLVLHQYNATAQNIGIGITGANLALVSTINSNIVDNGANSVTLVKTGPGGLVLGGAANNFTGGVVINGGNLAFNTLTALNNNKITANVSSTIHTFGGSSTTGDIELKNGSQLTILNNNSSFTVTGNVLGSGGISAANGGQGAITLNLNGTGNTFTGPIRFTHSNATQAATINVASLADTDTLGSGNITFGAGTTSSISHNFGLSASATGPVVLSNRRFQLSSDQVNQQINNASGQALTINSDLLMVGSRAKNLALGGAGAGISKFAGVIANHATPTAPGTVPIAVRTTAVVPLGGTLTLGSVEGIVSGATISGTGITAGTTIASVNPFTRAVTLSAATTGGIGLGTNFTIPDVVNSVSVTKGGTGTWVLTATNTYTGPTNISGGALNIQNIDALGATSTGTLVANTASLQLQGGFSYAAEPLTLTPGGGSTPMLRNISGNSIWNGSITLNTTTASNVSRIQSDADLLTLAGPISVTGSNHQFVVQGAGNTEITGQITGVGRLTSSNGLSGVCTVSNDTNSYMGVTSINGGTLAFTSIGNVGATESALGAPGDATVGTIALGATTFAGTLRYVGTAIGGHTSDRVINLASTTGAATIEANGAGPLLLTSPLSSTGAGIKTLTLGGTNMGNNSIAAISENSVFNTTSLTKSGVGTWVLTGINTYTGLTTVSSGTLSLGLTDCLADASNVSLGAGTLKTANAISDTLGSLDVTAAAKINLGTGATLAFADSSAVDWTGGALNISGAFVSGSSLRFGAGDAALTDDQLASITATGFTGFDLDVNGFLTAVPIGGNPYITWSGNLPFGDDANKDQVENGLAWLLGAANPAANANGLIPAVSQSSGDLILTFSMLNAANRGLASVQVQHSSDLGASDPWASVVVPESTGTVGGILFTVTADGTMNDVIATIPASQAAAGRLFGRLKGVSAP